MFQKAFIRKGVGFILNETKETAKSVIRPKTHGLAFVWKDVGFISRENEKVAKQQHPKTQGLAFVWKDVGSFQEKMAKCQRPKTQGLAFVRKGVGFIWRENEKMAKRQRPKIEGLTFARKSVAFILKENEKMTRCQRLKMQGENLHSSAKPKMVEITYFVKFGHLTLRPSHHCELSQDNSRDIKRMWSLRFSKKTTTKIAKPSSDYEAKVRSLYQSTKSDVKPSSKYETRSETFVKVWIQRYIL
jgi:hypothetical protein